MPKQINIIKYLKDYGDIFASDGEILFCKLCAVRVNNSFNKKNVRSCSI